MRREDFELPAPCSVLRPLTSGISISVSSKQTSGRYGIIMK